MKIPKAVLRNQKNGRANLALWYNIRENGKNKPLIYALNENVLVEHWNSEENRLKTALKPRILAEEHKRINKKIENYINQKI